MKQLDKIKVLLLEDEPEGLYRQVKAEGQEWQVPAFGAEAGGDPRSRQLSDLFEVRWLATAEDAREFRDLSNALSIIAPRALDEGGWVPEVLCFDYALTGNTRRIEKRLPQKLAEQVSPLALLRRSAAERKLWVPPPPPPPPTKMVLTFDTFGCYCGGLILTLFSAHPCVPVALTRKHPNQLESEASFFEWMLEVDGGGTFKAKSRTTLQWLDLLIEALPGLRRRIEQLLEGRVIEVGLDDLLALSDSGEHDGLEVRSRYSIRRLPVAGLFLDLPGETRAAAVRDWAHSCLDLLFRDLLDGNGKDTVEPNLAQRLDPTLNDFREGMKFAEQLWDAYNSELLPQRYRLSSLAVRTAGRQLASEEREELEKLSDVFGADPNNLESKARKNTQDLRSGRRSDRAKRWAALMVMVRLEMLAAAARQVWRDFCRQKGYAESFDPLVQKLKLEDVYLALFPVPSSPLKTPFDRGDDPRVHWKVLSELSSGREKKDLALDVKEVLEGGDWHWDESRGRCAPCGLLPGERYLLRLYARTLDLFQESWLAEVGWLQDRLASERVVEGVAYGAA